MRTTKLPLLNQTLSAATPELNSHLRAHFHRVSCNVLPIKADMGCLRDFCDCYLNFVDDTNRPPFYFKPALPFVILQLLHYPYMADRTQNAFAIAQSEIAFTIWLECYALEGGKRVFKTLALCTPFIYLDNQLSIITGRDVFGYPKAQLQFLPTESWLNPSTPSPLARLAIRVTSGVGDIYRPFLEVYQQPRRYASIRRGLSELLSAIPHTVTAWISLADRTWDALAHVPLAGYERTRDISSLLGGASTLASWIWATVPHLTGRPAGPPRYVSTADAQLEPVSANIITLKQFRDSDDPDSACYQAIVRSAMYATRLIDAGPLFDPLSMDPGGGISVRFHQTHEQPIVESFGLEVMDEIATREGSIVTLKPIAPFWLEADLVYGLGVPMYWRTKHNSWSSSEELGHHYEPSSSGPQVGFVTFGSGAINSLPTRYASPENVIRILPLPMRTGGIAHFEEMCTTLLTKHRYAIRPHQLRDGADGKAAPGFVFMIVRSMQNRMATTANPLGIYSDREVEFAILVDLSLRECPDSEPQMVALLPICLITDSETTEITEREVYGLPTVLATIDSPGNSWPDGVIASAERPLTLLRIVTPIIPAFHAGLRPENRVLVEVTGAYDPTTASREDERIENDRALRALRANASGLPIHRLALKQFPDCRYPERACYQAIVSRTLRIGGVKDCAYDPLDLTVRIYRYPSYPLADMLALKIDETLGGKDAVIDVVKPIQPFWVNGALHADQAQTVCWRAGASAWQLTNFLEEHHRGNIAVHHRELMDTFDTFLKNLQNQQEVSQDASKEMIE
jgi:hypothetical protein